MDSLHLLAFVFLLFTKHFIVDFPLQKPYQWMNKGTYGHPGGLLHAALHGWATYVVTVIFFTWPVAVIVGVIDLFVHYHIDWAKMNINRIKGWKSDQHEEFWTLLGLDQYLHAVTYVVLIWLALELAR